MRKKTIYTKAPKEIAKAIEESIVVEDFLPPPELLLQKLPAVKITLSLGKHSVDFFKKAAKAQGVPYQTMIRRVVDLYAQRHMHDAG